MLSCAIVRATDRSDTGALEPGTLLPVLAALSANPSRAAGHGLRGLSSQPRRERPGLPKVLYRIAHGFSIWDLRVRAPYLSRTTA